MGNINTELIFYELMNYPIPFQKELFYFEKKTQTQWLEKWFSRKEKNQFLENFIEKINKHGKLYQSLPFISEIFLCNSISFNAVKRDSDIDLFIITKNNSIWRARFFSAIFFKILWLKRSKINKKQKFCLSFYISEKHRNLYSIMLNKTDIYLTYWIAHLVPLYQEKNYQTIFLQNKWLSELLPNHPMDYCINIWNKKFIGKSKVKKILEFLFWWFFGKIIERIIKIIWLPILNKKIYKLWNKWKHIIINDNMLKFHDDIREEIHLLYKIKQKK